MQRVVLEIEPRVVKPQAPVQREDRLDILAGEVEAGDIQVLGEAVFVVGFGDYCDISASTMLVRFFLEQG